MLVIIIVSKSHARGTGVLPVRRRFLKLGVLVLNDLHQIADGPEVNCHKVYLHLPPARTLLCVVHEYLCIDTFIHMCVDMCAVPTMSRSCIIVSCLDSRGTIGPVI